MTGSGRPRYDAVVIGSGPNGLAAAVTVARAGHSVLVVEAAEVVGGGVRTAELTLPGFRHDVCSAIHPTAVLSPFFRSLPLDRLGLEWVQPDLPLAHPLDDGSAVALHRSVEATAADLDPDGRAWCQLMGPLVDNADELAFEVLGPLRLPRHPIALGRFGLLALHSAVGLARRRFRGERAQALFAGLAAHSMLDLERVATAAFGLVLGFCAHAVGWPLARGGSQAIADALTAYLRELGGEIETGRLVSSLDELPAARAYLFDVTPRQLVAIAGERLSQGYRRALGRYRYGSGVFKLDWALDGPIPWTAPECARAGTVHVGGTLAEIASAEAAVARGHLAERPYVLVAQQSLFDATRAPDGHHTGWAYCHVPSGSTFDATEAIENQVERFAPGFRDRILVRHACFPADLERTNPNHVGGSIDGGEASLHQLFTRPTARGHLYTTSDPSMYLCSSSTPPGAGVHGMCGYFAGRVALRRALR